MAAPHFLAASGTSSSTVAKRPAGRIALECFLQTWRSKMSEQVRGITCQVAKNVCVWLVRSKHWFLTWSMSNLLAVILLQYCVTVYEPPKSYCIALFRYRCNYWRLYRHPESHTSKHERTMVLVPLCDSFDAHPAFVPCPRSSLRWRNGAALYQRYDYNPVNAQKTAKVARNDISSGPPSCGKSIGYSTFGLSRTENDPLTEKKPRKRTYPINDEQNN